MFAVTPALVGAASIVAVVIAAITSAYQVVLNRTHNTRTDDTATAEVVVTGLRGLLAEVRIRNDELEKEVDDLRARLKLYRAEAHEALLHQARCERDLAEALRRIRELERRHD